MLFVRLARGSLIILFCSFWLLFLQLAQRVHNESLATRINVAMRMQFGDSATLSSGSRAVAVDEQSESSSDEEEVRSPRRFAVLQCRRWAAL